MAEKHDRSYDRAATKWLARLVIEKPAVGLEELRLGMTALEALPENPTGAKQVPVRVRQRACADLSVVRSTPIRRAVF